MRSCDELERLLELRNSQPHRQREIDRLIIQKYHAARAILILDMAGFTISVQRYGIIHHLASIHRMKALVGPVIEHCGGTVIKFDADNCFAVFHSLRRAVKSARQINVDLEKANAAVPARNAIHVSIGIGYGRILVGCDDLFGDEVNLTAKLSEDIAQSGEVFLTERAHKQLCHQPERFEEINLSISGIQLRAFKLASGGG